MERVGTGLTRTALIDDLADAIRAWDPTDAEGLSPVYGQGISAPLREQGARPGTSTESDAASSLERLRRRHHAQAAPDLSRVHPSWWLRAIREEPLSVQGVLLESLPAPFRETLRDELKRVSPTGTAPVLDRPPHPGARDVALALWSHRFAGDEPPRDDDRPAVAALTRLDVPTLSRLIREVGLTKWASVWPYRASLLSEGPRSALEELTCLRDTATAAYHPAVQRDIDGLDSQRSHPEVNLGMITFGRLLRSVDPHRVRWALQHLPYGLARELRRFTVDPLAVEPAILLGENNVLRDSWVRMSDQGRLPEPWRWGETS
ncbi:MAG: hypothetical protein U0794_07855 [Isosphaeraceae bacterium]